MTRSLDHFEAEASDLNGVSFLDVNCAECVRLGCSEETAEELIVFQCEFFRRMEIDRYPLIVLCQGCNAQNVVEVAVCEHDACGFQTF